jgi:hypothetical protein
MAFCWTRFDGGTVVQNGSVTFVWVTKNDIGKPIWSLFHYLHMTFAIRFGRQEPRVKQGGRAMCDGPRSGLAATRYRD